DGDGIGNNADADDDGDGVIDSEDAFPLDARDSVDSDGDGIGDSQDADNDNDGVRDYADAFPFDSTESLDTDGDGVGNNADTDDDGDGIADAADDTPLGDVVRVSVLGVDGIPVLLSRLSSGEISELTLSVDALSAIDVPVMPVGSSAFLYTLEPNGTYERLDQGYGYEYGLWSWDVDQGQLTLEAKTGETRFGINVLEDDFAYTNNFNFAAYEALRQSTPAGQIGLELEELFTQVFTLTGADQPADHWVMSRVVTGEVYLRSTEGNSPPFPLNALVTEELEPIYTFDASEPEAVYVGLGDVVVPLTSDELIGTWAIEINLATEEFSCRDNCGRLVTFSPDGTASLTSGRNPHPSMDSLDTFDWSITAEGRVVLARLDGLVIELAQNVRYADGLSELIVVSRDSAAQPLDSGNLLPVMQSYVFDTLPDQGIVNTPDQQTVVSLVTDDQFGEVLEVNAVPLPLEGAATGISLGAAGGVGYIDGGIQNKSLVFDIKLLESGEKYIALTTKLDEASTTGLKYLAILLDGSEGWQTKQVDFIELGSPETLRIAEQLAHYFSLFSVEPVHYQIANIRVVEKSVERAAVGLAVRRDDVSIAESDGALLNKPLLSGFFSTRMDAEKRSDGDAAETFGFMLNDDQSMLNFDSINMSPFGLMRPVYLRSGQWSSSDDGARLDLRFCSGMFPDNGNLADGFETLTFPACNEASRHRTWQKLAFSDSDQDGVRDRLYVLETISLFIDLNNDGVFEPGLPNEDLDGDGRLDVDEDANGNGVLDEGEDLDNDGRLDVDEDTNGNGQLDRPDQPYFEVSRTNFYDVNGDFDLADVDGDGIANEDDALPNDFRDSVDTDLDGIGNSTDIDDDNDGVPDALDALPLDAFETVDTDGDGIGNNADADDDGDGVPDRLDAFPFDPSESVDTDGDGVGDNRDEDDDNDNVADDRDDSPRGEGYLDDDRDGVVNRDDADADGDGVPEVIAELLADDRASLAYVTRSLSGEGVIPNYATGFSPFTATMRGDGTFLDGAGKFAGDWEWDGDAQALNFVQITPDVRYEDLREDRYTNIDWARYEEAGRPQVAIEYYYKWRYTLQASEQRNDQWIVLWESESQAYLPEAERHEDEHEDEGHGDEDHHDDVMSFAIDPAKPILSEPLGTYPAQEQLFAHERMINPLDEGAVVGTWGMNLILPGDEDGCLSSDGWNQCGRLAEFDGDGTGEVDGRLFTWSISGAGTLLVDMVDQ
ncbi:hypothetical protein N9W66_12400, partial [Luminiphilus sp.]|nr:hypothetical protein [Luminiphilus sp.]